MENDDMIIDDYGNTNDLGLSNAAMGFLQETGKWAKFMSIMGFIGLGFMVIAALFLMMAGSALSQNMAGMPVSTSMFGLVYLIIAGLYFVPIYYLYNFSVKIQQAIANKNSQVLEKSFEFLKSHYKFIGILMIVMLGLYVLMFIFGLFGGIAASSF